MDIESFNRQQWKSNHVGLRYFVQHPLAYDHSQRNNCGCEDWIASKIKQYGIDVTDKIACEIGVGFGRLAAGLSSARLIYGIDVSQELLNDAVSYLSGVVQFKPVLSDDYKSSFPPGEGDFVYSAMVMQHIPSSMQLDYLRHFSQWLKPGGEMLIQFLVGYAPPDPFSVEPHFFWRVGDLFDTLNKLPLVLKRFDIEAVESDIKPCYWAWAYLGKNT